jgi:hypothetical protein
LPTGSPRAVVTLFTVFVDSTMRAVKLIDDWLLTKALDVGA